MLKDKLKQSRRNYNKKIAIIGTGYVGAGIAYSLMLKDIAREIVLIDSKKEVSNAEMLDIRHGIPNMGSSKIYCGEYKNIEDCDLIIITAGRNRKANETRLDLANDNIKISAEIVKEIKKHYNQGVILVVANPVDILTHYYTKNLNLPKGRIFGTGCILDSSRLINIISDYIELSPEFISATVVGEHGNSQTPLWDEVKISNIPIEEFCKIENLEFNEEIKQKMAQKVLNMGTEIIKGKGKTYYGIATCVCHIADAILNRRNITASVSSNMAGNALNKDISISLPSLINYNGVKLILPSELSETEKNLLNNSALQIEKTLNAITNM